MARLHLALLVAALLVANLTLPAVAQEKVAAAQSDDEAKQAEIDKQKQAEQANLTPEEQEKLKQQQADEAKAKEAAAAQAAEESTDDVRRDGSLVVFHSNPRTELRKSWPILQKQRLLQRLDMQKWHLPKRCVRVGL